jgi:hypothetical protein
MEEFFGEKFKEPKISDRPADCTEGILYSQCKNLAYIVKHFTQITYHSLKCGIGSSYKKNLNIQFKK